MVPRVIPRAEHSISRGYIDPDALKVLYRLHKAGFKAYLVGGSVRDLMTGRTPKDFDVGTDARPQEIRRVFRNSRIIGRRFRLVHVLFENGKVVEVSTFRRTPDAAEGEQGQLGEDDLLIRSDNTFGSPAEDAVRRDFTINGLFYDIATFAVIDYVGGVADLERRLVRSIGDPQVRFREDPVRMMRACEFAGRLGFEMTPDVREAILETRNELRKAAAPRVTEELLDPLRRGWGEATYRLWMQAGILDVLFPELDHALRGAGDDEAREQARNVFWKMMVDADARARAGDALPDAALLGVLFLPLLFAAIRHLSGESRRLEPSRVLLVLDEVVNPPAARLTLPNLTVHLLKQGLYTMGRLAATRPSDPGARRIVGRPYFPTALLLLDSYSRASGRYRPNAEAWMDVMSRAGTRPPHSQPGGHRDPLVAREGLGRVTPFPEALLPPSPAAAGFPPAPGGEDVEARVKRRRPRRRRRSEAPA